MRKRGEHGRLLFSVCPHGLPIIRTTREVFDHIREGEEDPRRAMRRDERKSMENRNQTVKKEILFSSKPANSSIQLNLS